MGPKTRSGVLCCRSPVRGEVSAVSMVVRLAAARSGERKGAWEGGRYSRSITPAQRHQAWKDYWAAKRAQNTALVDIPDISEELQTLGSPP